MSIIQTLCSCLRVQREDDDDISPKALERPTRNANVQDKSRSRRHGLTTETSTGLTESLRLPPAVAAEASTPIELDPVELDPTPRAGRHDGAVTLSEAGRSQHAPDATATLPEHPQPPLAARRMQQTGDATDEIAPVRSHNPNMYVNVKTALEDRRKLFERLRGSPHEAAPAIPQS